jgi:thiamine kinase-like enzyme
VLLNSEKKLLLEQYNKKYTDKKTIHKILSNTPEFIDYLLNNMEFNNEKFTVYDCKEMEGGDVNMMFSYTIKGEREKKCNICIKKYLPFRKKTPKIEFSDAAMNRGMYEYIFSKIYSLYLKKHDNIKVINTIDFNKNENILIMENAQKYCEYKNLINSLISIDVNKNLGKLLSIIQNNTYNKKHIWERPLMEIEHFNQRCIQANVISKKDKKFLNQLNKIIKNRHTVRKTLIHDSFCPQNIFVNEIGDVLLFDFEFTNIGDPAWDIGYLIAHYIIEIIINKEQLDFMNEMIKTFSNAYKQNISDEIINDLDLILNRVNDYIGLSLLHRSMTLKNNKKNNKYLNDMKLLGKKIIKNEYNIEEIINGIK